MESNETKKAEKTITHEGDKRTVDEAMKLGRYAIVDCVRHLIGQERCDLAFASGVMAGLALEVEQHEDGIEAMSPEEQKRETMLSQIRLLLLGKSTEVLETIRDVLRENAQVQAIASLGSA